MTPDRTFFQHSAVLTRPTRTDISGTIHATKAWSAPSGIPSPIPCAFQPRGTRPVQTSAGIGFAEIAGIWVEADELGSGGEVLGGDRLAVTFEGSARGTWEVESLELVNDGYEHVYSLVCSRVITA